jgi:outer membrane protein assembly factor BamB
MRPVKLATIAIIACAGCSSEEEEEQHCVIEWRSNETTTPGLMDASNERAAFVLSTQTGSLPRSRRAAVVDPMGTLIETAQVPMLDVMAPLAGTHSTLWSGGCTSKIANLVASGAFIPVQVPDDATSVVFVFDGATYRMLWRVAAVDLLRYRTIAEDGAVGDVHEVTLSSAVCSGVAYDNGKIFIGTNFGERSHVLDLDTNTIAQLPLSLDRPFVFGGEVHTILREPDLRGRMDSYDPATGNVRVRQTAFSAYRAVGSATYLYISLTSGEVVELDRDLAVISRWPEGGVSPGSPNMTTQIGILDGDLVRFERVPTADSVAGHLDIVRVEAGTGIERWRTTVATDSAPFPVEVCD